ALGSTSQMAGMLSALFGPGSGKVSNSQAIGQTKDRLQVDAPYLPNDFMTRLRRIHTFRMRAKILQTCSPEQDRVEPTGEPGGDGWAVRFTRNWPDYMISRRDFGKAYEELGQLRKQMQLKIWQHQSRNGIPRDQWISVDIDEPLPNDFMGMVAAAMSARCIDTLRQQLGMRPEETAAVRARSREARLSMPSVVGQVEPVLDEEEPDDSEVHFERFAQDFRRSFYPKSQMEQEIERMKATARDQRQKVGNTLFNELVAAGDNAEEGTLRGIVGKCIPEGAGEFL
ncbi:hypothetical protein ACFLX2_00650, partial [Candidatus Dependentiae bacterium]